MLKLSADATSQEFLAAIGGKGVLFVVQVPGAPEENDAVCFEVPTEVLLDIGGKALMACANAAVGGPLSNLSEEQSERLGMVADGLSMLGELVHIGSMLGDTLSAVGDNDLRELAGLMKLKHPTGGALNWCPGEPGERNEYKLDWWAYLHSNGTVQVKRWYGDHADYQDDCAGNPFVLRVLPPFKAGDREEAFAHATRELCGGKP